MFQKLFLGILVVLSAFFIDGMASFLNNPQLEQVFIAELQKTVSSQLGISDLSLETEQEVESIAEKSVSNALAVADLSTDQTKTVNPSITPKTQMILGETTTSLVTRVIDGDTIELDSGEKVRYIGIDTPETKHPTKAVECYGEMATQKNIALVLGKEVLLEKDVSHTDRYGRLLRYVYVINDHGQKIMVNEYLVQEGYATVVSYPPDVANQTRFLEYEAEARKQNKGLWGADCEIN